MQKICAIHQPNFLPWLGYFYKIAKSDVFVILDNVDILTGTSKAITNRTKIKTSTGEQWLTVPIKKGNSKIIKDIEIQENNWRIKMLKTIQQSYSKSEYYNLFYPFIEELINHKTTSLSEFNTHIIREISKLLKIKTKIILASDLNLLTKDRNQRIVDICKAVNCNIYLSGKGGTNYHDENVFKENEILIKLTDFQHPVYAQLNGSFVKGLSIIDYLLNNGIDGISITGEKI